VANPAMAVLGGLFVPANQNRWVEPGSSDVLDTPLQAHLPTPTHHKTTNDPSRRFPFPALTKIAHSKHQDLSSTHIKN
jgi:hypothetical protein